MRNDLARLAADMQRAQNALVPELLKAEGKTLQKADDLATKYSSGTVSTEQLSTPVASGGYGHPYGHGPVGAAGPRGPIPYGDPAIINRQTGNFLKAWTKALPTWSGNVISSILFNFSIEANFLSKGTALAIKRPIDVKVANDVQPTRLKNLDRAVKALFSKFK